MVAVLFVTAPPFACYVRRACRYEKVIAVARASLDDDTKESAEYCRKKFSLLA